jgi:hypothetical protein
MRSIFTILLVVLTVSLQAQKLPTVQQVSLRAPVNIKIDGKATEWGAQFQAYNAATDISYTMANDDKKLYLVFQATERFLINKIVNGGLKLSVQKNGSKTDLGAPGVQFPYFEKGKRVNFATPRLEDVPKELLQHVLDSVMQAYNTKLRTNVKWIYTKGITGVDSLLSIYNDRGIEVANAFDTKRVYTCEMAIDLKNFGLSLNDLSKFSYHITLNGGPNKYAMGISFGPAINDDGTPLPQAQAEALAKQLNHQVEVNGATTDFWGEYTLTK